MDVCKETLLKLPQKWITADLNNYLTLLRLKIICSTPYYLENDSILLFVNSGKGFIIVNGCRFELEEGSFCYLQNYNVYRIETDDSEPLEILCCIYDCCLSTYFPNPFISDPIRYNEQFYNFPVIQTDNKYHEEIRRLFLKMEISADTAFGGNELIKTSILGQIQILWNRINDETEKKRKEEDFPIAWRIWIYITKHSGSRFSESEIAQLFNLSISDMDRELRAISGYGFKQLLNRAKILNASAALLTKDFSLNYLSRFVGFKSEATFYRVFEKYFGMTPDRYREHITSKNLNSPRFIKDHRTSKLYCYVFDNYRNNITLMDTAKRFYFNEESINENLRKACGMGFLELLNLLRVEYASTLLCGSDIRILDIAMKSGFDSIYTFLRQFKKVKKITPTEFRSKHQYRTQGDVCE